MAAELDRRESADLDDYHESADTPGAYLQRGVDGLIRGVTTAPGSGVTVRRNSGADVGTRPRLNLIEGESVTLAVADDAADDEVDVTIAVVQINGGYF